MEKYNAKQLRDMPDEIELSDIKRYPIYIVLDNVYDTYNIGGLFRLSDALAASGLLLCGISETPPNSRIKKASIGTYKVVPWTYHETTIGAIEHLRATVPGIQVVSVELADTSVPYTEFDFQSPVALVVGNETHGVSSEVLNLSDGIVDLPMKGYNISLNVIVSAAVVGFHVSSLHAQKS